MRLSIRHIMSYVSKMSLSYYAVAKGKNPGIYHNWSECQAQIHKFSGARFKKFSTKSEAEDFIKQHQCSSTTSQNKKRDRNSISSTFEDDILNYQQSSKENNELSYKQKPLDEFTEHTLSISKRRKTDKCENETTQSTLKNLNYIIDEDGYVNVFTDGACSSNGRRGARAGIGIWFGDNHPLNVSKPVIGRATNNMAEIQAVTVAAKQAKQAGIKKLKINTDSKFLISCITTWMHKWKQNDWRTNKGSVINKTELLEMEEALECLEVIWNHVRGHAGIHGNEMADKLARQACNDYKP